MTNLKSETVLPEALASTVPVPPEILEVCELYASGIESGVESWRLEELLRVAFYVRALLDEGHPIT